MEKTDFILVESDIQELKSLVSILELQFNVKITQSPSIALTMIKAEDSVEGQEFNLGECLITDCEVSINDVTGYGICKGDESQRAYCIAVVDAVMQTDSENPEVLDFLKKQEQIISQTRKELYNHIIKTRVDFKMMEQA
jgi:alpha-D-ribose 1-methylphosphonate 5-triphosphate synthase subunit PhnG